MTSVVDVTGFMVRVNGQPIPFKIKALPRCKCGLPLIYFNENADYKAMLKRRFSEIPQVRLLEGPISLQVVILFPRGKDVTGKPDWDNLAKTISDACTEVFFKDDCRVTDGQVYKRRGTTDSWEVLLNVSRVGEDQLNSLPAAFAACVDELQ
jgi:Holliday junction resolvase RusA-like endonuclease